MPDGAWVTIDGLGGFQTSAGALVSAVQRGADGWDGQSSRFIAVIGVAWDLMPGDFLRAMNTLKGQSAQYVFVRDDQLMKLIRQAGSLPSHNTNATVFPYDSGTDGFLGAARAERDEEALEAPVLLRAPAHHVHDRRRRHRSDRVASPP